MAEFPDPHLAKVTAVAVVALIVSLCLPAALPASDAFANTDVVRCDQRPEGRTPSAPC